MFSLTKESLHLATVNLRKEFHGDEEKLAVDLKLEFETSNAVLLKFSPTLRDAFYTQDPGATQDLINPDHAPKLRNPEIGDVKWTLEMPCVRFAVFGDGSNDEEIVFSGAKCGKFKFTLKEGGTTIVAFTIQKSEPMEMDVTKLAFLMGKMIKVSLEEEEEPEFKGDDDGAGGDERPDNVVGLFDNAADDGDDDGSDDAEDEAARKKAMGIDEDEDYAALYDKAAAYVRGLTKVSVSVLKRELKVIPLTATRLLDQMESEGIVSEPSGNGVREVFAAATA